MAVSDVQFRHLLEQTGHFLYLQGFADHIQGVADLVIPYKIVHRRMAAHVFQQESGQKSLASVGQEHRPGLGFGGQNVIHPVRFLHLAGQFMAF